MSRAGSNRGSENKNISIETVLSLQDIEKGSLKTTFVSILQKIPEEALRTLNIREIIGSFLVRAKYYLLKRLEGKESLTDLAEIKVIQADIDERAEKMGLNQLPFYTRISPEALLKSIGEIKESLKSLDLSQLKDSTVAKEIESEMEMILKVKKPDYLGKSKWDFKYGDNTLSAKIDHEEWLRDFQEKKIEVRPKDSLACRVKITSKYDRDFKLVDSIYEIVEVVKIHSPESNGQTSLEME